MKHFNSENLSQRMLLLAFIVTCPACGLCAKSLPGEEAADLVIPPVEGIHIDADLSDWLEPHFTEALLLDQNGRMIGREDGSARLHLAWQRESLLLAVEVTDDSIQEAEDADRLWLGDSIELFFAPERGAPPVQVLVSPGVPSPEEAMRIRRVYPETGKTAELAGAVFKTRITADGYVLEAMIPLEEIDAEAGSIGLQVYVNDSDPGESRRKLLWYPESGTHADFSLMHSVALGDSLSDTRSDGPRVYWLGTDYEMETIRFRLVARDLPPDTPIHVQSPDGTEQVRLLEADGPFHSAELELPLVRTAETIQVTMEGRRPLTIELRQALPFVEEIDRFLEADAVGEPVSGGKVLFLGSSSFRLWGSMEEDLSPLPVINRGFGGSTAPQARYYANDLVSPHDPEIIVIYEGDNDLARVDADRFFRSYQQLVQELQSISPESRIVLLPVKPCPARMSHIDQILKANALIRKLAARRDRLYFVDTASPLLKKDGSVREELFLADGIHLNADGYALWTEKLKPVLVELYHKN